MIRAVADETPTIASWTCPTCGSSYPGDFRVCPRDATPRAEMVGELVDPLIGAVLGRTYRITRVLGEGGMAKLYEAKHVRVDARYAVKILHEDLARDSAQLARFEREARAAAKIRSEHVVQLFDLLRTNEGRPCLITELLEGEDLQTYLDRVGKMSIADAIPITRQLCRAVAAAHAVGVVHRDLKPANVFLCNDGNGTPIVKVFDFGVAKLEDDERLTRTDAVMGTAAYMAPEQARRAVDAGPLADVYSIGAVVYHMVTGQQPYGHVPAVSRFALVLHQEPARPSAIEPSIPPGFEAVIQHAMARDPASRVATALELETELAAFESPVAAVSVAERTMPVRSSSDALKSAEHAIDITLRAKFARPLAVLVAAAASLAVGAWTAALFAIAIRHASTGERALIGILAAIAFAAVGALQLRRLVPSWNSATAVIAHTRAPARMLVVGMIALGALELGAYGLAAVFRVTPLGPGARMSIAGAVTVVALVWHSCGLRDRVMRWIS